MALYKVNRPIVMDFQAYNPGSQIELTDKQAAEMKNGQITLVPPEAPPPAKLAEPAKQTPKSVQASPVKPAAAETKPEPAQDKPAATGTETNTAPVK